MCRAPNFGIRPHRPNPFISSPTPTPQNPDPEDPPSAPLRGILEEPGEGSYQSGIGNIRGWICDISQYDRIALLLEETQTEIPIQATGLSRADTETTCGNRNTGFLALWNWNLLGDGEHRVSLIVDGQTLVSRWSFRVTIFGEDFLTNTPPHARCQITDFPSSGETAHFIWDEASQGMKLFHTE